MNSPLYLAMGAGFILLTVVMYALFYQELRKAVALTSWDETKRQRVLNRFLFAVCGWAVIILAASASGFFLDFSTIPPRMMIPLGIPLIVIIYLTFSSTLKEFLPLIPQRSIIRLQVFRVFVEILLWVAFVQDQLPVQTTFEGRNFDILPGLAAPLVAYLFSNNRAVLYIYNFISLGLLINIVVTALLSLPTPFRVFMNEPSTELVAQFPFILLPAMLVPMAYGLSFLSLRQLFLLRK